MLADLARKCVVAGELIRVTFAFLTIYNLSVMHTFYKRFGLGSHANKGAGRVELPDLSICYLNFIQNKMINI